VQVLLRSLSDTARPGLEALTTAEAVGLTSLADKTRSLKLTTEAAVSPPALPELV
jgi:hypothetical protein